MQLKKISTYIYRSFLALAVAITIWQPLAVFGEEKKSTLPSLGLDQTIQTKTTGIRTFTVTQLSGHIISYVLGIIGVIFLGLVIYAGLLWMTARGNTETVKKALSIFTNAVLGLVIVVLSYYLVDLVFTILEKGLTS